MLDQTGSLCPHADHHAGGTRGVCFVQQNIAKIFRIGGVGIDADQMRCLFAKQCVRTIDRGTLHAVGIMDQVKIGVFCNQRTNDALAPIGAAAIRHDNLSTKAVLHGDQPIQETRQMRRLAHKITTD